MGEIFQLEDSEFAGYMPDDDIQRVKILSVKVAEKPYKDDDGVNVKKVEFKTVVVGGEFSGNYVWGETPTRFNTHPDCKLRNWAQSILGQELPPGYRLDTDVLQDAEVRAVIGYKEYTKGDGTLGKRNFIKDLMPTSEAMASYGATAEEPFSQAVKYAE